MPGKLSDLIDKLADKFPEDEDVLAVVDAFDAEYGEEEGEDDMEEDMFGPQEDGEEEAAPADFDSLFEEDMGDSEEEDEEEMPLPKKGKKSPLPF